MLMNLEVQDLGETSGKAEGLLEAGLWVEEE